MTRLALSLGIALTLFASTAGPGQAEEKKVQKSAVPKPVLDAVAAKYPHARMGGFESSVEEGKTLYEVELADGGSKMDVELTADGKIVGEESVIKPAEVPPAVQAGLAASKYRGWKVEKIEKVVKDEKAADPSFEYVVSSGKKKLEVVLDRNGKVTKEEDKSKGKDND
jgi:hypothetical protein